MRRNRVDPWGDLYANPARGLLTGNRGCLVDDSGSLKRHHQGSLWIACLLAYEKMKQPLEAPRRWTPLFFLDDAVALAAGHRPCGYCRRSDYRSYRNGVAAPTGLDPPLLAVELNRRLARERHRRGRGLERARNRILWGSALDVLPAGTVVIPSGKTTPHLVTSVRLQPFSFDGWGPPMLRPSKVDVDVLTPPTSVAALRSGFAPILHHTAEGASRS